MKQFQNNSFLINWKKEFGRRNYPLYLRLLKSSSSVNTFFYFAVFFNQFWFPRSKDTLEKWHSLLEQHIRSKSVRNCSFPFYLFFSFYSYHTYVYVWYKIVKYNFENHLLKFANSMITYLRWYENAKARMNVKKRAKEIGRMEKKGRMKRKNIITHSW